MLVVSFAFFSDCRSLKNEKGEKKKKNKHQKSDHRSLIYGAGVPRVEVYIETNPGWLELSLTGTNFNGPSLLEPLKFFL